MLRGSRCLVRFQVGPQQNQALTSFFLGVPFSLAHDLHKKRLKSEQLTPPMLRGSRCLVRFQVGPQQNQALTSFFLGVPFLSQIIFKKTKDRTTDSPDASGQ